MPNAFLREVEQEIERLHRMPAAPVDFERLPAAVRSYYAKSVRSGVAEARVVRLTQTGEMQLAPDKPPVAFTSTEHFATHEVAFVWNARVRMAPMVGAVVVDRFAHGRGMLDARLFGTLSMAHDSGPDTDVGEAQRYLAELPWVPQAIALNAELQWRSIDDRKLELGASINGARAVVTLKLDAAGDIATATARRPRAVGANSVLTPWGGVFSAYRELGGLRVPTHAEVWWDLPEGRFVYWRGDVTGVLCE
jgi:hypothetical protein